MRKFPFKCWFISVGNQRSHIIWNFVCRNSLCSSPRNFSENEDDGDDGDQDDVDGGEVFRGVNELEAEEDVDDGEGADETTVPMMSHFKHNPIQRLRCSIVRHMRTEKTCKNLEECQDDEDEADKMMKGVDGEDDGFEIRDSKPKSSSRHRHTHKLYSLMYREPNWAHFSRISGE